MTIDQTKQKRVCGICVEDTEIRIRIEHENVIGNCDYCDSQNIATLALEDLAALVDGVYRKYYQPGEEFPYFEAGSDKPLWDNHGESPSDIVEEMLHALDRQIAEDIVAINDSEEGYAVAKDGAMPYFDESINYVHSEPYDPHHSKLWDEFCETVKHRSRFFNAAATALLNEIFDGLEDLEAVGGVKPVREFGAQDSGEAIFRGRRADSTDDINRIALSPIAELGPPPKTLATAGRMNPAGISVLYGSPERETCVAELRAPVGANAVTGKFEPLRPIRILDLTALIGAYKSLSMFSEDYPRVVSHLRFLRRLDTEISKPVLPDDEELEYIPTQALTEYLYEQCDPPFEGVIYSSAQMGEEHKNIVLLPPVMQIKKPTLSNDKKVFSEAHLEDEYLIFEAEEEDLEKEFPKYTRHSAKQSDYLSDEPILGFVDDSIETHEIKAIEYRLHTQAIEVVHKSGKKAKF